MNRVFLNALTTHNKFPQNYNMLVRTLGFWEQCVFGWEHLLEVTVRDIELHSTAGKFISEEGFIVRTFQVGDTNFEVLRKSKDSSRSKIISWKDGL